MYIVAIFALVLLSPLPFVSPFSYDVQSAHAQTHPPDPPTFDNSEQNTQTHIEPSLEILNLNIKSDNVGNVKYANTGNTITINFSANEILHYNATAVIHNKPATVSISDKTAIASITILETDPDGYANFTLTVSSRLGLTNISDIDLVDGDTTVFVDKHVPVITINGSPGIYLYENEQYNDLGAIVTDDDPLYVHTVSVDSSNVQNTVGTYTVEYTASADGAGNVPFTKTRKVFVQPLIQEQEFTAHRTDVDTIELRFPTGGGHPILGGDEPLLKSSITVDGLNVTSAYIPGQVKSVFIMDNDTDKLDFLSQHPRFGSGVSRIGDINGDGHEDLAIGVRTHSPATMILPHQSGGVAILHMNENATAILDSFILDENNPNFPILPNLRGLEPIISPLFGNSIEGIGDVNGDGFTDIAVGAPWVQTGPNLSDPTIRGAVYILFLGVNGTTVLGHTKIDVTTENGPEYPTNSAFGSTITNMGDLNNDGISDIAVAAYLLAHPSTPENATGSVFIIHLGKDGYPLKTIAYNETVIGANFPNIPIAFFNGIGYGLENMGDLNGDGYTDIMIGGYDDPTDNVTIPFFYIVHLGKGGESMLNITAIPFNHEDLPPYQDPNQLTRAIVKLNDVNGDGLTDVLLSDRSWQDVTAPNPNAILSALHIIALGENGTTIKGYYSITEPSIRDINVEPKGYEIPPVSSFGFTADSLGDVNSDGSEEIVVGAYEYRSGSLFDQIGTVHILSLADLHDDIPHVIVKTSGSETDTTLTPIIEIKDNGAELQTKYPITTPLSTRVVDRVPPILINSVTITNSSLNVTFSEPIQEDILFTPNNFKVSNTTGITFVTSVEKNGTDTILLGLSNLPDGDTPLVEVFNSALKDNNDNVIEYARANSSDGSGPHPLNAYWSDVSPVLDLAYVGVNFKGVLDIDRTVQPFPYFINDTVRTLVPNWHGIDNHTFFLIFNASEVNVNSSTSFLTFDPKEDLIDSLGNHAPQAWSLPIEQNIPPKILDAFTSKTNEIHLIFDKRMAVPSIDAFNLSDSLSVKSIAVDSNVVFITISTQLTNQTPTVTINGSVHNAEYFEAFGDTQFSTFPTQYVPVGTSIIASDRIRPIITSVDYIDRHTLDVQYSKTMNASTINVDDFIIDGEVITSADTTTDGMTTRLTFETSLSRSQILEMNGVIHDKVGIALLTQQIQIYDVTPAHVSSIKTFNDTSIIITLNEKLDVRSVLPENFDVQPFGVSGALISVLDVILTTSTPIPEDSTPVVSLTSAVTDIADNNLTAYSTTATDGIPPSISTLSIESSNSDPGFAKNGNQLVVTLTANEPISYTDASIIGLDAIGSNVNATTITATVTVLQNATSGNPIFIMNASDSAGNNITVTESNLTVTNIIVDTSPPNITLFGLDEISILVESAYTEDGSYLVDNDPNYATTVANISGTVNTTLVGVYNITYYALADSAGNIPANRTRTVTVYEPDPINVMALTITSNGNGNIHAREGQNVTVILTTDGTDLGNVTGAILSRAFTTVANTGDSATFTNLVESGDNGNATFSITVTNSSGNQITITQDDITDDSFVTTDTTNPVITLYGANNTVIIQNSTYIDPGAIAIDASYRTQNITGTGTIDTSTIGIYTLSYKTPDDLAGNVGPTITRIIDVQDHLSIALSDIHYKFGVSPVVGITDSVKYPILDGAFDIAIAQINGSTYALVVAFFDDGVQIIDITNPFDPSPVANITDSVEYPVLDGAYGIATAQINGSTYAATLTVNGTIGSVTLAEIESSTVTPSTTTNTVTIIKTVTSSDADTNNTSFTITVTNEDDTTSITFTNADLTGSPLVIDQTAPIITLTGDAAITIFQNDLYVEPGFSISDSGNPTYTGTVSATSIDTSILGVQNITYTGTADAAGNTPDAVNRTITIQAKPLDVTSLTIQSDNANNAYAKLGDQITATLTVNGTIGSVTLAEIESSTVTPSTTTNTVTIIKTVTSSDADTNNTSFTITVTNEDDTTSITFTNADLTGSPLVIDQTAPIITLTGDAAITIFQNDLYVEPGFSISDSGNPTYTGTVSATSIDTSILGVQNITYTGTADAAGNTPDAVNRTITIQAKPLDVTSLTIQSDNANNAYAKLGNQITATLTVNGTIGSVTLAEIESSTVTPSTTTNTVTIIKTVTSSDADTNNTSFTITVTNEDDTTSITFTNADLTGSPLVIDQTAPIITLTGDAAITIFQNDLYVEPGFSISDSGNPTYTGTVSATSIDTSILGVQNITYTGTADAAGNTPDAVNRTITIQAKPLDVTSLTIQSDNANNAYAKLGDQITATLTVNGTIENYTIDILQPRLDPSNITQSGNQLNFTYPIPEISIENYTTFNVTVTNFDGVNKSITQEDVTSGLPIFVDTVSPRISLTGSANHTIIVNTIDPVIPGAIVTDGDPNYSGTYNVTTNGTLDTSTIGSTVLYTYTADADGAGNLGENTTRIVTVVDVEPINITALTITSNGNDNIYAREGQNVIVELTTDGTDLGNVTGTILGRTFTNSTNGGSATFTGIVESGDNGNATFFITVTNSSRNQITITQDDITDDTYVTIDTIKPVITLINPNDNTIRLGATYVDPGATVVDASYDGNQTIYSNNSVNTNVAGNYTLSYTVSDLAGNTQNITRNVTVIDLSINITSLTINSDNDNSSYAKAGDTLTIHLSVNDTITSNTVDILLDQDISATVTNDTLTAFTTVPTSAVENNATFSINITNSLGVPRAITQDDLTSSNVFIDTIAPRITLSNPIPFIAQNDSIPDADAIALDGDPNYNYTIPTPIGSIDNTTIGVYFRTYTPNPDNAGNIGENATQRVVVTASNGTVYLNTSVINNSDQHFDRCSYDVFIRVIIFENILDHNNTLRICASIIELDLSNVDTISGENTIVPHEYNYELQVSSRITVHILKSTNMTSITDNTDSSNFTIAHSIDEYRDTTVQIGSDNARYTLTNSAIGITFENIPASYKPYIRHTTNGPYEEILGYYGDQITNGTEALAEINSNSTFNDALYQYNPSSKTGTVWTLHLSQVKTNSTSSGSDDKSSAPTIGKTSKGARLVTNGFQYNDLIVDAERYHTELPLLGTNVGEINTIKIKVYDGTGPEGIKRVEFALGVPDIGLYHSAEAFIEVWMEKDTLSVKEIIIEDDLNILENSDISATVSQTSCSGDQTQCLLLELQYSYREPPVYNTIAIKPVDRDNDAYQFYFNDGIHVDGDSINLPKEMQISTSHAINHIHTNGTLHLIQTDRAENMWIDQYGFQWKIIGNTIRQITMPEYIVPTDNKAGILHGPDRNHPDFELTKYAEQLRAQSTLAEMLGKSTILKPYPEHGGTIYFNATDRDGEAFKLLLELETERMEQIASLMYENDQ
ncbi:MAG: FG-GAP repeat domain protein [Cenarchaeum symbiont of Oopsacas minuta]|nr:FG-GAP repeat domain protein [Cenarchaeum symbiont of Oopsacas minuta]